MQILPSSNNTGKFPSNSSDADFVAYMCHEIATPLHVIISLSQMLITEEYSVQQKKLYGEMLQDSSAMVMDLLKNMLDSFKMDSGRLEVEHIEFDLAETVQQTVRIITSKATEKHIDLHVRIAEDLPPMCMGDPLRLQQILLNLLGNAIKFTEIGHVTLYVGKDSAGDFDQLCITVTDTGIGIGKDAIERIFNRYIQADTSISRKYGGTGLGLAISRDLVHLMQGQISVKSWPGFGSRFVVTLPLKRTALSLAA